MTIQEEVMRLAAQVPGPPGEPLPPGLSDAEIEGFTRRTGLPVPPELREWLRFTNGPCIGPGGLFGIRPRRGLLDIERALGFVPVFRENGWLPLGTDGCGDYYVLALGPAEDSPRPVLFVDPHGEGGYGVAAYAVGSGLWPFLRFLFRRELGEGGWPFDQAAVLAGDPGLAEIRAAPLPWDTAARRPQRRRSPR
jgi:SMI1 / KNR4 family (SUKH-1)